MGDLGYIIIIVCLFFICFFQRLMISKLRKSLDNLLQEKTIVINKDDRKDLKNLVDKMLEENIAERKKEKQNDISLIIEKPTSRNVIRVSSNRPAIGKQREIETLLLRIPTSTSRFLWFENGFKQNIDSDLYEPSAIDMNLPVSSSFANLHVGYFPSYRGLSDTGRGEFLTWLQDIRQTPNQIGYAFIYFYALERHLETGDFDGAFWEIMELSKYHEQVKRYALNTLFRAVFRKERPDLFGELIDSSLFKDDFSGNTYLMIRYIQQSSITAEELVKYHKCFDWTNNRYIKTEKERFIAKLKELFSLNYQTLCFELKTVYRKDWKACQVFAYNNLSLKHIMINIPSLEACVEFRSAGYNLLATAHEMVKRELEQERKK